VQCGSGSGVAAYNNDFRMMTLVVAPPLLLVLMMRKRERTGDTYSGLTITRRDS
jgi:hypothetical protein